MLLPSLINKTPVTRIRKIDINLALDPITDVIIPIIKIIVIPIYVLISFSNENKPKSHRIIGIIDSIKIVLSNFIVFIINSILGIV